jgi:hypothetical protein
MPSSFGSGVRSLLACAAVALAASALPAGAATLGLTGGTAGLLPASFNPSGSAPGIGPGTAVTIFDSINAAGGGLSLIGGTSRLSFTFLGKEAAWLNFALSGATLFSNQAAIGTSVTSGPVGPGLIDFAFLTTRGTASALDDALARNGGPISLKTRLAFYLEDNRTAYAFFDDGGAGPDADFDDMVVQIAAVPLPASLLLLLTGIGGLGALRLRRRTAAV